jgi:hypothetical protein
MDQTTQQPILKMEISDNYFFTQHLVGGGEVKVCLIEVGPSIGLMAIRVYKHRGECHDWRLVEAIDNSVGTSCFILDVEVELLQVCGQLLMEVIIQFTLCLHEMQWLMISVDDCFLPKNVMSPLVVGLKNGVHLFVVSRVLTNNI